MARWMSTSYAELGSSSSVNGSLIALLSGILVFIVCVTALLALCAAHSSSSSSSSRDVLNARRETSSEPEELAVAPPEEFKKQHAQDLSSGMSFRLSSSSGGGGTHFKLSSSINKLSSSFRISSFRESSITPRATSSFRISSFRMDSCKQAEGVVGSLRKVRHARLDEPEPAVWQRAILRGERCAPLSFSGLILYDENGNQLPTSFNEDSESSEPSESPPRLQLHQQPSDIILETPSFGSRNGNIETVETPSFGSRNGNIETGI